ncbi:MAG: hypothetical protein J6P75_03150 [Bacteroidales bacterium]|nr:hypothetical protein [Bacteroidales bacterium]
MKRLAYITLAFFATAALFSCTEKSTYEPGPQPSGAQYYFSADAATAVTINQATSSVSVDVFRVETGSAGTLTVNVADESGLISSAATATANFAAGSNKATLSFPINPSSFEFAKGYPVTYTITDETTPYGQSELKVTYTYPTPLTSLGKGSYEETYMWGASGTVEFLQSDLDPNEFHVRGLISNSKDDFIFHICQPGHVHNGVTVTQNNLLFYNDWFTGVHNSSYDDDVYLLHPSRFSAGKVESAWSHNTVVEYQENGLPGMVTIGCSYYMFNVGGWSPYATTDCVIFYFPGYDPKDYTLEATYAGMFTESDGTVYGEASVTLGADIENAVAVIVAGEGDEAIAAGIEKLGSEEAVAVDGSSVRVPLPKDVQTGFYTIVVGGFAEGEVVATDAVPFYYQGGPLDWDWLLGAWNAYDYNLTERVVEGDPYEMTITKVDDTHIKIANIWGSEAELDAVVDFDAMTITIPGNQFVLTAPDVKGDLYFVAVDPENEYDVFEDLTTPVVVKMTPGGLVVDNYDFYIGSGNYKGYTYDGGIRTTMFKPLP